MPQPTAAEQHQAGQAALVSLVPAAVVAAWPLLDPHNLSGTTEALSAAVQAIVHRYGQASAAAALDFYRQQRSLAGVKGRGPALTVPRAPSLDTVTGNVRWAVSGLYGAVDDAKIQDAQDAVAGSAQRLVLDQSRETLMDAAIKDPAAKGFARVTSPGACAFCTMLALRAGAGFLYRTKESAGFRAHAPGPNGGGLCRCSVEPVFNAYEPPYFLREMQQLWVASTKGQSDPLNAFRRALAKRPTDA